MASEPASVPTRQYPPPPKPEPGWPPFLAILVAIALQILLPERLTVGPSWLIPVLEGVLLIGLAVGTPKLEREHPRRRVVATTLTALVSAANIYSLTELTHFLLHHNPPHGQELIFSGLLIWLTNVLIFSLWFWELDRGGPGRRAAGHDGPPDFLFTPMTDDAIMPANWRPGFVDYLYVALTNATALSPTDTMPLTQKAKCVMGLQSLVSIVTLALVISRAVGILG
ncbi:MAG TPA: hypothetical protein VGF95_09760 [Solirubrobacteraceae bacterium]|jgi:uncharacterized membrane protein